MKTSLFALLRQILLVTACLGAPAALFGQGNDNPTGVAGVFNGNSNTGCSYDPYTGNATRTIPDITVTGAVGAYPLQWARTMNSRGDNAGNMGAGGGWRYSYQWKAAAPDVPFTTPTQYTVSYPDGRVVTFASTGNVANPYLGPLGVADRFSGGGSSGRLLSAAFRWREGKVSSNLLPARSRNQFLDFHPRAALPDHRSHRPRHHSRL